MVKIICAKCAKEVDWPTLHQIEHHGEKFWTFLKYNELKAIYMYATAFIVFTDEYPFWKTFPPIETLLQKQAFEKTEDEHVR